MAAVSPCDRCLVVTNCVTWQDEDFATWLRDRYSEVDITAVLLSIRYNPPSATHLEISVANMSAF